MLDPAPQRPNLLLLWTDEQRADVLAATGGDPAVRTPNLDRLASESFVFRQAYCCQPVCTPSRGSILTGLWPWRHGAHSNNVPLDADAPTLAERVDPAYRRAYHGKWHLGDEISAQHGFDEWLSVEDAMYRRFYTDPKDLERRSDYHHFLYEHGHFPDKPAPDGALCFSRPLSAAMPYRLTKAGFLGSQAAGFLRRHDPSRPFLLSVNFLEPHMPFFGPYNDRYDPADMPAGPAFCREPDASASLRNRALAAHYREHGQDNRPLRTESDWRRVKANYYGLVEMVDRALGEILDALQESGMAENTVVAFTSDHGEMMGDHAQIAKGVLYEEAVRVPCMIRVPWLSRQRTDINGPFSQIDLAPTLLDLLGEPLPEDLQGRSRRPVLEGRETLADNDAVVIWDGLEYRADDVSVPGATREQLEAVRDQRWRTLVAPDGWKLNLCATDPRNELYHLNDDPAELENRIDDPAQKDRVRAMTERLRQWQRATGDDAPLPDIA